MIDLGSRLESYGAGRVESSIVRVPSERSYEVLLKSSSVVRFSDKAHSLSVAPEPVVV